MLAVAAGPAAAMKLAGLIALSDPPRTDSAALISELHGLGVRTVMVTGDAPATAAIVAKAVGLDGAVCPPGPIPDAVHPEQFAVFAGVLPEDKYKLVKAFQKGGHTVGMCGDGANDAPALRQAQMGIAVSTATDVAKSAAGMVLTEPGLAGIVAAVKEGRITFQRILSYTLNSITKKTVQVLFLAIGLLMTGHAILTPLLMVLIMITGDFLGMSLTTDNVRPSPAPNAWRIGNLTIAGVIMGIGELLFCTAILAFGAYRMGFTIGALQTLGLRRHRVRQPGDDLHQSRAPSSVVLAPQHLAPSLVRRRSPDRLDLGRRRHCDDASASVGGGRHAGRGRCLRDPPGLGEGAGYSNGSRSLEAATRLAKGTTMKISSKDFRVREGDDVDLKKWPTLVDPVYKSKEQYQELLDGPCRAPQRAAAASLRRPTAMPSCWCFRPWTRQARTARSGTSCPASIRKAARCSASSTPAPTELQHDFLWRTTRDLPERGRIGIFNRSYYEEVLIVRVHRGHSPQRGAAGRAARRQDPLARSLSVDLESGEASPRQRDPHHQVLPPSFEGGAAQALPRPDR